MLEAELISSFHFVIEQNTAAEAKPRICKHVVFQEKRMLFRNPLSVDSCRSINPHYQTSTGADERSQVCV